MEKTFHIYLDARPIEYEAHIDDESVKEVHLHLNTEPKSYAVYVDDESENGSMDTQSAENAALSEAYAKGTVHGTPVAEGNPGYQDNSKYYKEAAERAKAAAEINAGYAESAKDIVQDLVDDLDVYYGPYLTKEISTPVAIAEFSDGADGVPLRSLEVQIPRSYGDGIPSPDHPIAIQLWSEANIAVAGKNLYRVNPSTTSVNGLNIEVQNGVITASGTLTGAVNYAQIDFGEVFLKAGDYIASGGTTTEVVSGRLVLYAKPVGGVYTSLFIVPPGDRTFSIGQDSWVKFAPIMDNGYQAQDNYYPMIRRASVHDGSFEAFIGNGVSVSWQNDAGTICSGNLFYYGNGRWTLQETYGGKVFDGTENWSKQFTNALFRHVINDSITESSNGKCSHFDNARIVSTTTTIGYYAYNASGFLQIRPSGANDMSVADWKNWIKEQYEAGTPLTCTWRWTTPKTYELTAADVCTILGKNNIWADCGNIAELTYRIDPNIHEAETQSEISDLTAEISDLTAKMLNAYPTEASSGAIASTSVGADDIPLEKLVAQIVSSQDLNGFDAPWIGGGGVNKFGGEIIVGKRWYIGSYIDGANNYAASATKVNCAPNTEYRIVLPDITQGITFFLIEFGADGNYLRYQTGRTITAAGKADTFTTDADTYLFALSFYVSSSLEIDQTTMTRCAINYPSTETDWTPYENICPISGWTGAKVCQGGTELSVTTTGGSLDDDGNEASSSNYKRTGFIDISTYQSILTSVTSNSTSGWYERICLYDKNQQFLSLACKEIHSSQNTFNHVIQTNGAAYVRMSVKAGSGTSVPKIFGSGKLYPVSWQTEAGTVCSGTLTDNGDDTWTLVVTHIYLQFDGTEGWQDFSGGGTYNYFGIYLGLPSDAVVDDAAICSHTVDNPEIGKNNTELGFRVWNRASASQPTVIFRFGINQSEADFIAFLAAQAADETPVTICFELAESARQTYTITTDSVKSLLGDCNVWADTGDVSAVFRCDPTLYINGKISAYIVDAIEGAY